MEISDPVNRAYREGRLALAHDLLLRSAPNSDSDRVLSAELLQLLGRTPDASRLASRLLLSTRLESELKARCATIVAETKWQSGKLKEGLDLYQKAVGFAEKSDNHNLLCRTRTLLLERISDSTGFDASVQLATLVRRAVARSEDAQVHALVHLTFGRLEAKVGHVSVAQKHIKLARIAAETDQNLHIQAAIDLDEASVLWLLGDVRGAIDLSERGALLARESGWSRGRATASANLAWLCVCAGRLSEVSDHLSACLSEPSLSPSLQLALADTEARALMASGTPELVFGRVGSRAVEPAVESWYRVSADLTHVLALLRLQRPSEALDLAENAIALAAETRLHSLKSSLELARADALVALQRAPSSSDLLLNNDSTNLSFALRGQVHAVLGRALRQFGTVARAASQSARARRIFESTGDSAANQDIDGTFDQGSREATTVSPPQPAHLDAAVALLELSGHPQILGREAFVLLHDTGCAQRVALVARSSGGTRVVAADGWTETEATAAVDAANPDDLLAIGQHREDTWLLLAEPRTELEHRCTLSAIKKLITTACALEQYRRDEKQRAALWPAEELEVDGESLWISERSADLLRVARRIASAPIAVLLTGETGTGKEMLARVIHRASNRADKPFQPFNCTAVPRDMIESQLFGYRKGAFTGAETAFPGIIRAATGGTLFLDEIGDVSADMQPKLLRFLENQEVHPLGEPHAVKVDVRIIAATNGNLEQLVADGRFREDLFYRLKVLHLQLPPLRERREEIPALTHHFIRKFAAEQRKGTLTLSDETLEYLLLYPWPGNVRQLANEIQRMVAFADIDATLTPSLLSPEILASRRTIAVSASHPDAEMRVRLDQPLPEAVEALERTLVRRALERSHGRVEEAARLLGISRKGLFLKRRRWGLRQAS